MVNIERLEAIKQLLKTEEVQKHFSMDIFFRVPKEATEELRIPINTCGTAACIAGHVVAYGYPDAVIDGWGDIFTSDGKKHPVWALAAEWLGLDSDQFTWLFYGHFQVDGLCGGSSITTTMAIAALDHLIAGKPVVSVDQTHYVTIFDRNGERLDVSIRD